LTSSLLQGTLKKLRENLFEKLPWPLGIGVGEGRSGGGLADAEVVKFPFRTRQPVAYLQQAIRSTQLAEKHCDKLRPTVKPLVGAIRLMPFDRLFEIGTRKKL